MKRRVLGLLLSFVLLLSLSGCVNNEPKDAGSSSGNFTVYINVTAHRYHRQGCTEAGPNSVAAQLVDAKKNGYRPCNKCDPPR